MKYKPLANVVPAGATQAPSGDHTVDAAGVMAPNTGLAATPHVICQATKYWETSTIEVTTASLVTSPLTLIFPIELLYISE